MKHTLEIYIANGLTSLTAVIIPMVIIILGLSISGADLLYKSFPPEGMSGNAKIAAAAFLGVAIAMALMSVSVNNKILTPWSKSHRWIGFPLMIAGCSFVLLLFFFDVLQEWDSRLWHQTFRRVVLSGFLAFLEYMFAHLFVEKFKEVKGTIKLETQIIHLKQTIIDLNESNLSLTETNKKLKGTQSALTADSKRLAELKKELKCRYCKKDCTTLSARKNHEGRCKEKPKGE